MKHEWKDITETEAVQNIIALALEEDIGDGDVTSRAMVPETLISESVILTREPCVIAGGPVAAFIFRELDPQVQVEITVPDGQTAAAGETIMKIHGKARAMLTAERTALNFMQRMSGIATHTAAFVKKSTPSTLILDTRKTTPALRVFEKYAVVCGGGTNHRSGLFDKILIKDNHRALWKGTRNADLGEAVKEARRCHPDLEIEIEVENDEELLSALEGKPDWILLDNMTPGQMAECVRKVAGRCRLEASGGITLNNIEAVASSGVDAVSLGCLTHTVRSVDLSLEMQHS